MRSRPAGVFQRLPPQSSGERDGIHTWLTYSMIFNRFYINCIFSPVIISRHVPFLSIPSAFVLYCTICVRSELKPSWRRGSFLDDAFCRPCFHLFADSSEHAGNKCKLFMMCCWSCFSDGLCLFSSLSENVQHVVPLGTSALKSQPYVLHNLSIVRLWLLFQ